MVNCVMKKLARAFWIACFRAQEVLVLGVFVYFAYFVLVDLERDTTLITNAAFGITATFSALCFSFARAIHDNKKLSTRIVYAGERCFHAALFLAVASVIKWAAQDIVSEENFESMMWLHSSLRIGVTILIGIYFSWAALFVHTSIRVLNVVLLGRITSIEDWDDII